jgi:hypothetical protein
MGGETPELEADVPLAKHATPIATQPSPSTYGHQAPSGFLALQPTQAAGHGEIHPHGENEQPSLLNPAPFAPRKSRSRRQPASAQPKLTRLQARAGNRKRHHVLEDTSDADVQIKIVNRRFVNVHSKFVGVSVCAGNVCSCVASS